MILVDANQILVASILPRQLQDGSYDVETIRRSIFRSFMNINERFTKKYGKMVICFDSKSYWRADIFQYYKANRKTERAASSHDWKSVFQLINSFKSEIKINTPFLVMEVDGSESDDIIAVLCRTHKEEHVIISEDKDFIQLHSLGNVRQFDWPKKRDVSIEEAPQFILRRHIVAGDRSDGIPNVFSADDTFVTEGKRQKRMSKEKIDSIASDPNFDSKLHIPNWNRNNTLINFEMIPEHIVKSIHECYNANNTGMGFNYSFFNEHKITESLGGNRYGRSFKRPSTAQKTGTTQEAS